MAQPSPPTSIAIGPHTYTVAFDAAPLEPGDLLGHCDRRRLTITLDPNQAATSLAETALHETLHAITDTTGLADEWGDETEERNVRRLAPALLDLLRRNPTLITWLVA